MSETKTISKSTTRAASPSARYGAGSSRATGSAPSRDRYGTEAGPRRGLHPLLFGLLLLSGGIATWGVVRSGSDRGVPDVWTETSGPDAPVVRMVSELKPAGPAQGKLLRLEWPEHPRAESYRIRFTDAGGYGPAPVPVQSTVFLYDMDTNVLNLPSRFDWTVIAVLPDGSEVITPRRSYP